MGAAVLITHPVSRRAVLCGPVAVALRSCGALPLIELAACVGPAPTTMPNIPPTALGIDVHAHAFNARDLPIPGFVLHVVLERDEYADVQLGPLVTFIALLLDAAARSPDAEIDALNNGTEQPFLQPGAAPAPLAAFNDALFAHARAAALQLQRPDARAAHIIARVQTMVPAPARAGPGPEAATDMAGGLLGDLASLTPGGRLPSVVGGAATPQPALAPQSAEQRADSAAHGVVTHASNNSGVFYLAGLVTRPRAELVRRLITLPAAADNTAIALVTPALIDFSFWLDERANDPTIADLTSPPDDVEPLASQIAVMRRIAAGNSVPAGEPRRYAVHPFVSFCPWRQIAEQAAGVPPGQQQFALVRNAVEQGGFIGVKLYPVMGFRPIDNAAADDLAFYPARLRRLAPDWAEQLDAALARLYDWCVEQDVPVMAHCSFSQYPSAAAGRRGAPARWRPVLDRWNTLRLNLAHCGGVWDLAPNRAARLADPQQAGGAWPLEVLAMFDNPRTPNLYADLADFSEVLAWTGTAAAADTACGATGPVPGDAAILPLARAVACHPAARKRLMYGTDFMFLVQADHTERYIAAMRDRLAPALGIDPSDFMAGNAASFLGLTTASSQTRRRLNAFRGDAFLDRWLPARSPPAA